MENLGDRIWNHLETHVSGSPVPFTDANISLATNLQVIHKNYKLHGLGWLEAIKEETRKKSEMEKLVISAMALRGV